MVRNQPEPKKGPRKVNEKKGREKSQLPSRGWVSLTQFRTTAKEARRNLRQTDRERGFLRQTGAFRLSLPRKPTGTIEPTPAHRSALGWRQGSDVQY